MVRNNQCANLYFKRSKIGHRPAVKKTSKGGGSSTERLRRRLQTKPNHDQTFLLSTPATLNNCTRGRLSRQQPFYFPYFFHHLPSNTVREPQTAPRAGMFSLFSVDVWSRRRHRFMSADRRVSARQWSRVYHCAHRGRWCNLVGPHCMAVCSCPSAAHLAQRRTA